MEEKKEKKKINKIYILIFTLAIISFILGVFDLKANAAEEAPYVTLTWKSLVREDSNIFNGYIYRDRNGVISQLQLDADVSYAIVRTEDMSNGIQVGWRYDVYKYDSEHADGCKLVSPITLISNVNTLNTYKYVKDGEDVFAGTIDIFTTLYGGWSSSDFYDNYDANTFTASLCTYETNIPVFKDYESASNYFLAGDMSGQVIDYDSLVINDEMPTVTNLYFDRIEKTTNNGVNNIKIITDYIRFDANSDYELVIMLCPSIYSTIGDSDYLSKFELYQYDSWIYMTTSETGLKEISCELGQFVIPTNNVDCIVSSNYEKYYEDICCGLSDSGQLIFKPTMGYRLAYIDLDNNVIGPSTYIIPNYYDNFNPKDETYSYFVLYSDGTRGSEKIINLKTWEQEENSTLEGTQNVIDKVGETLGNYVVIDSNLGTNEATNWLKTVVSFISDTPKVIGSVLIFLPRPILYGVYICIFLGVVASGIAIIRALI